LIKGFETMKPKTEEKILHEFIKVIDDPDKAEKKFLGFSRIALAICVIFIFYCLSNGFETLENKYYFALFAFISGMSLGLAIWFIQAGTQTKIMVKHMSRESINRRIDEINSI